jgi:hypothetical protein
MLRLHLTRHTMEPCLWSSRESQSAQSFAAPCMPAACLTRDESSLVVSSGQSILAVGVSAPGAWDGLTHPTPVATAINCLVWVPPGRRADVRLALNGRSGSACAPVIQCEPGACWALESGNCGRPMRDASSPTVSGCDKSPSHAPPSVSLVASRWGLVQLSGHRGAAMIC